ASSGSSGAGVGPPALPVRPTEPQSDAAGRRARGIRCAAAEERMRVGIGTGLAGLALCAAAAGAYLFGARPNAALAALGFGDGAVRADTAPVATPPPLGGPADRASAPRRLPPPD